MASLIPWEKANIHVMSHVIHYGSSVFEGIRCYTQPGGAGIFRLTEHMQRLIHSAKIYRMPSLHGRAAQRPSSTSSRPTASRPATSAPSPSAATARSASIPCVAHRGLHRELPLGQVRAGNDGADVCISSWNRLAPNTMPSLAKAGANYMNSQLIRMEAEVNGYVEGIALDTNGYLSEGSGENLFVIRGGTIYTAPLANSVLNGITRDSILVLARQLGIPSSSRRCRARCSTSATRPSSPAPPPRSPPALRRPHPDRRRHHGPDHHRAARCLLQHRQRPRRGPLQLAHPRYRSRNSYRLVPFPGHNPCGSLSAAAFQPGLGRTGLCN
jgi:branched-chain amino acid aminotransferase